MSESHLSPAQKTAYLGGIAAMAVAGVILMLPGSRAWDQPGPDNVGHVDINCVDCHTQAPGSARQQIQANVQHWLGRRDTPAWFGRQPVGNGECLNCHENENDLHPVYRFNEPRFAEARQALAPQYCVSCHRQHEGNRVSFEIEACRTCHQEIDLREDPIDVPHAQLTREARWETCMGCHDFHGNHDAPVPETLSAAASRQQIETYLDGGRSPYGNRRLTVMQTMKVKQQ